MNLGGSLSKQKHKKNPSEDSRRVRYGLIFVALFTLVGVIVLISVRAATSSVAFEPEKGTVSSPASKATDNNASGGSYVLFGPGTCPAGTTGVPPNCVPTGGGGAYNPDPWCQFHVMGSLYGDAKGNGPANGASWNANNTSWGFSETSAAEVDRFERCARYMVTNNIGGNKNASVSRNGNQVNLSNFWPMGVNTPFYDDRVNSNLGSTAPALAKRAFLMSVIEGEGEKCDPVTTACPTGQIADNYKTLNGGTNPNYYKHLTALVPIGIEAGLTTTFTATGSGCNPQTEAQLASGGGGGVCIKSSDFQVIKNWPVAACGRVPGYGAVSGYQCGKPDAP